MPSLEEEYDVKYEDDLRLDPINPKRFAAFVQKCLNDGIMEDEEIGRAWLKHASGMSGDPEEMFDIGYFLIAEKSGKFICLPADSVEARTLRRIVDAKTISGENCSISTFDFDPAACRPSDSISSKPK